MCEVREESRVSNVEVRNVAVEVKVAIFMYAVRSSGESEGVGRAALVAPLGVLPWFVAGLAGCPGMVCTMALRAI